MNKKCTRCKESKLLELFPVAVLRKDKRGSWCNVCCKAYYLQNKERFQEQRREKSRLFPGLYKPTKEKRWKTHLKHFYGMSVESYNELVKLHNNKCGICFRETKLNIDHNHATGKVRGLLCGNCNRAIGCFKEDLTSIKNSISYLEK